VSAHLTAPTSLLTSTRYRQREATPTGTWRACRHVHKTQTLRHMSSLPFDQMSITTASRRFASQSSRSTLEAGLADPSLSARLALLHNLIPQHSRPTTLAKKKTTVSFTPQSVPRCLLYNTHVGGGCTGALDI
jgi:hypothetical protein